MHWIVGNDSNECDGNVFPGRVISKSTFVVSHLDDIGGVFTSQPQIFTDDCGGSTEND